MANMIDDTVFIGDIYINTTKDSTKLLLEQFIEIYEPRYITFDVTVENEDEVANMLAHFIYFEFVRSQNTINTSVGNASVNLDNAIKIQDVQKLNEAYNFAVEIYNKYAEVPLRSINHFGI